MVISDEIELEYYRAVVRPGVPDLFARHDVHPADYLRVVAGVSALALRVDPRGEAPVCRDENDRKYLHCASTAQADFLVSFDKDLLVLHEVETTAIVTPAQLLDALRFRHVNLVR